MRVITEADFEKVIFQENIILESNDREPVYYEMSRSAAKKMSKTLAGFMENQDAEVNFNKDNSKFPVPEVNGKVLKYVVEFMEYHEKNPMEEIEKPLKTDLKDWICEWDEKFLYTDLVKNGNEKEHELLLYVICAANFLNINDLLQITCACVANMIRGKTVEQERELFGIVDDFTPEQRQRILEENKWIEDA